MISSLCCGMCRDRDTALPLAAEPNFSSEPRAELEHMSIQCSTPNDEKMGLRVFRKSATALMFAKHSEMHVHLGESEHSEVETAVSHAKTDFAPKSDPRRPLEDYASTSSTRATSLATSLATSADDRESRLSAASTQEPAPDEGGSGSEIHDTHTHNGDTSELVTPRSQRRSIVSSSDEAVYSRLRELGLQLEGPVKKYPQGRTTFLSHAQGRYIKLTTTVAARSGAPWRLPQWLCAGLAYWTDKQSCKRKEEPRGRVLLMRIAKVTYCGKEEDKPLVKIRHKVGDDKVDLQLIHASKDEAEQWAQTLRLLITTLRKYIKDMGITAEGREKGLTSGDGSS